MSGFVLHDVQGQATSIGTGLPPVPLPAGLAAVVITDADFVGVTAGTHRWNPATRLVEVDTVKAALTANQQTVDDYLAASMPTMQTIIDTVQVSGSNTSQLLTAIRAVQTQLKDVARLLRRVDRALVDDYTSAD